MSNDTLRLRAFTVCAALCLAPAAHAADDEGPVTAELGGRLHWDFTVFDNDERGAPERNDTQVRRAWLDVAGKFYGFNYKAEAEFAGLQYEPGSRGILARDVYLAKKFAAGTLTVGQFKQYFSLDDRTGSNYGPFLERGYAATTLAPIYRKAISWQANRPDATWSTALYSLESIDNSATKGGALGTRLTFAPEMGQARLRHLGVSLAHERYARPGSAGTAPLLIRPRPENDLANNSRITLARFADGRDTDFDKWSLEYAEVLGPWSWQSEFSGGLLDDGSQHAKVLASYGLVSWFVTGESRGYDRKTGRFSRIATPNHRRGAFELALRYDYMRGDQHMDGQPNFIDASTQSWTLGGNWYFKPNLRVMLNVIDSRNRDRTMDAVVDHTLAVTGRFQYDF
ncbi:MULTISPECIES: OprO/OprP family phosphate-selective porin [Xanthomonas]|uniref:Porin n=1 Tax=Xanthomonas cucurbitae TaxID=56453 RepID=A0A2S7DV08_9XANT|nr:OprO/OprP family phosphate-selective porin [Xanthomonas cucurbitae]PPU77664.1 porin [Xanthomonas cucurbitae]QHG88151.1 porin [Xanthomonas cucurbitae]WDM67011.1 porin [Xanthomonas cucurbitae]WDM70889.1 porin [Xanthomonas cucurbitae]WDM74716.1 porin [Xanthomonas cucurbitae]